MTQCEAVLLAEGIPSRWTPIPGTSAAHLDVPTSDLERAARALSEVLGEELRRREARSPVGAHVALLLQPPLALAVGLTMLTLVFFAITSGSGAARDWAGRGALDIERLVAGDWWRLITAATLHADLMHAASNASFFLVLAWGAAERFGTGVTLGVWLLTAVVGFVVGVALSDAWVTVGASGGLFGLLGAAAGHAVRYRDTAGLVGRERLRAFAGGVLLLAFTAFSPRANIHAHVGGFVAGLALGALLPAAPLKPALQLVAALVSGGLIFVAWRLA
ncbi:MAG: rhomboid family intramembrane serine protease [Deltaproteobacteria bacterium]|nr:rhomboid family intramembrane serine protease [Deltaproteobacteria bacterium]